MCFKKIFWTIYFFYLFLLSFNIIVVNNYNNYNNKICIIKRGSTF